MAITRRQFVTRLSALAAAAGISQGQLTRLTESLAYAGHDWNNSPANKPKVLWVHGAECTGCSTSLLGLFEDLSGTAILDGAYAGTDTVTALGLAFDPDAVSLSISGTAVDGDPATSVGIADILIDVLDLQYHETVMGMGGDLAYQYLADQRANADDGAPFVLVVEGALQHPDNTGAWDASGSAPWCSIGMSYDHSDSDDGIHYEHDMSLTVNDLATSDQCLAVIAIGQCATYGGYPGCVSPIGGPDGDFAAESQTGAVGVYDFLLEYGGTNASEKAANAGKVINVPGCPTNPWWFVLTVVAWLVDANAWLSSGMTDPGPLGVLGSDGAPLASALDSTDSRRLNLVFGTPIHGPACPRYQDFLKGIYATEPGTDGCLQLIGCKGHSTNSLCGAHGWNAMQPENDDTWDASLSALHGARGSFCITAGHPCMACSEKGYPDAFLPFIDR